MLYRGITQAYKPSDALSWWSPTIEHAVRYCSGQDGAQLLAANEEGLQIVDCPEEIGDSWLADEEGAQFAISLLREMNVDGFRREDEAGMAICLLPEAIRERITIYEQF